MCFFLICADALSADKQSLYIEFDRKVFNGIIIGMCDVLKRIIGVISQLEKCELFSVHFRLILFVCFRAVFLYPINSRV